MEHYEELEIESIVFDTEDVIVTSCVLDTGGNINLPDL